MRAGCIEGAFDAWRGGDSPRRPGAGFLVDFGAGPVLCDGGLLLAALASGRTPLRGDVYINVYVFEEGVE